MSHSPKGDGVLRYQGRLCVSDADYLRRQILDEAYGSQYFIHTGATKIYCDLQEVYLWNGLKKDIVEFMSLYSNCQEFKAEHQRLGGLT